MLFDQIYKNKKNYFKFLLLFSFSVFLLLLLLIPSIIYNFNSGGGKVYNKKVVIYHDFSADSSKPPLSTSLSKLQYNVKYHDSEKWPKFTANIEAANLKPRDKLHAWDTEHCVWFNYTVAEKPVNDLEDPTLCVHATSHYLPLLIQQKNRWNSFISLALFINSKDIHYAFNLKLLQKCSNYLRQFLTVHLVYKADRPFLGDCEADGLTESLASMEAHVDDYDCDDLSLIQNAFPQKSANFAGYPINVLRNIARVGALTDVHVISDIENIFSANADVYLKKMIKTTSKEAKNDAIFVIRRFEAEISVIYPENIQVLQNMMAKNEATFFHQKFLKEGHFIPYMNEWFEKSSNPTQLFLQHIPYLNTKWEPLTVVRRHHPYHFEGLLYRVKNQRCLSRELCLQNYQFYVASHLFTVHRGIKKNLTKTENDIKNENLALDTINVFEEHLAEKYPHSAVYCRGIPFEYEKFV